MYLNEMLPLFVATGDDGNYAQTAASDLSLLQVRQIYCGGVFSGVIIYDKGFKWTN